MNLLGHVDVRVLRNEVTVAPVVGGVFVLGEQQGVYPYKLLLLLLLLSSWTLGLDGVLTTDFVTGQSCQNVSPLFERGNLFAPPQATERQEQAVTTVSAQLNRTHAGCLPDTPFASGLLLFSACR